MPTKTRAIIPLIAIFALILLAIGCPEEPPRTYTITYVLDGGTNAEENPASYQQGDPEITLHDPTKRGHIFGGWFAAADFSGTAVQRIAAGSTGDITLHAKWTANTYTVSFDSQGGSDPSPATKEVTFGTPYGTLPTITFNDPGHEFAGWYTATGASGTKIEEGMTVGTADDHTLYAHKSLILYPLTYHLNGGTNDEDNPISYTIESATITLQDPTRSGYTFTGWFAEADFSGTRVTEIPQGSTGDKTLHAKWNPTDYAITYHLDDGTNNDDNPPSYTIESDTIALDPPTLAGYTFAGWFATGDFSGTQATEIPGGSTGDKALYAKWVSVVTFDGQGATTEASPETKTVVRTTGTDTVDSLPTPPQKTGYTFDGWWTAESGGGTEFIASTAVTGNITVHANWVPTVYAITYILHEGTNDTDNPLTYTIETNTITLKNPARALHNFTGWFDNSSFSGSPVTEIASELDLSVKTVANHNRRLYRKVQVGSRFELISKVLGKFA